MKTHRRQREKGKLQTERLRGKHTEGMIFG